MNLTIDGIVCGVEQGETILDAVRKLGLDSDSLKLRPLAAQIGGEVFSLRYTPFRDVNIHLLRYGEEMGRRVYERTLEFVLITAARKLFPGARVYVRYSLGPGLYISVEKAGNNGALTEQDVLDIESEMRRLVRLSLPLERKRLSINEAVRHFEEDAQADKAALLRWRRFSYFDVYSAEGYMDYFYGEMAPCTAYVDVFRLKPLEGALVMLMPRGDAPDVPSDFKDMPKLAYVFHQSDRWGKLMRCDSVNQLNSHVENGTVRELIRVNEALHERSYSQIADKIVAQKARAVMVAGPSSSGKTTSAHRIATQLRVLGQNPVMLSLDNYYLDRDAIPLDEHGERDLEHINTLDIERFKSDIELLLQGEQVEVPEFDFTTGKRSPHNVLMKLHSDEPLIVEGIHGLNPVLVSSKVEPTDIFRVYVSALTTLNLDDHNRIRTTDVRLLRRLVRDYKTRNASMEQTLSMWPSVRRGEETWIFPYQENGNALFNTTLVYEIAVLKKYVYPLLTAMPPESPYYAMARDIVKFLNYFVDADAENEIPPTSILREFIGGNTFYL
ncbi:MAG: nucleoside kinase [Clostridiaceae bacterium]|nr:nucleoside kinase [Eubacteriales bacterium]